MQQSRTHEDDRGTEGGFAIGTSLCALVEPAIVSAEGAALWFTYLLRRKAHHAR
ncbi:hypothetical protein [Devosia sp.]|uniref:hypothetical protein n=1 Tax=Devosia sp. TaxID=1871048 RepID=UPI002AFE7E79|nr:hypothetical protein [Devosia sp.]